MNHPKYALDDQVQIVDGQGSVVLRITGISQASENEPFRYESEKGTETRFFSEQAVIAVLRDGKWHAL